MTCKLSIGRRQLLAATGAVGLAGLASPAAAAPELSWQARKKHTNVFGSSMAHYEVGTGRPIVFLHGNPTSSYLWRNIIPHVQHLGRCIAPDLIGMGDSAKLPNPGPGVYSYQTHRRYLFELLRLLGVERDITFVIHDWGSALGFDFASQNPGAVRGLAYAEAILTAPNQPPRPPETAGGIFEAFYSAQGEHLILDENTFVERILIGGLRYYLTAEDEAEYRRPYLTRESRWPTLQWPRELPPFSKETAAVVGAYSQWLATSSVPKLFMRSLPGALLADPVLLKFARSFPNQREVTVFGPHYVEEVSPHAMGRALAEWIGGMA